jgi:MipA family protein
MPAAAMPSHLRHAVIAAALFGCALGASASTAGSGAAVLEDAEPPADPARDWDATLGLLLAAGPEFPGASRLAVRATPGFALRWGRVSFASRSAFAVRTRDGATAGGGLRVELGPRDGAWRSGLGLRWDSGRREDSSDTLRGLGDVRGTLRARLATRLRLDGGWRVGASAAGDLLGRGGGWLGDLEWGRDGRFGAATTVGAALTATFADRRYLRSYYGITPVQAAASGYPVYTPGAGLRELSLGVGARTEWSEHWVLFYGAGVSRLMGPAAASPLVTQRNGWGLSAGLAYRL